MSIVAVNLAGRKFELSCSKDSKDHILALSSQLDDQVRSIMRSSSNINFDLALVIAALNLQDAKASKISQMHGEAIDEVLNNFQATLSTVGTELENVLNKIPEDI